MEYLEFAKKTALKAGKLLLSRYNMSHEVAKKKDKSFVTEADKMADSLIKKEITKKYPKHAMLTEETGASGNSSYTWVIDPLDGTSNYLIRNPVWCVSIGLVKGREMIAGVVYSPFTKEMFYASKGKGAFLNGKKIRCSDTKKLSEAWLTVSGSSINRNGKDIGKKTVTNLWPPTSEKIRIFGSAAMSLCYTASGRIDGYIHPDDKPWDHTAGALIVKEAGGKVSAYPKGKVNVLKKGIVASNSKIHKEFLKAIK